MILKTEDQEMVKAALRHLSSAFGILAELVKRYPRDEQLGKVFLKVTGDMCELAIVASGEEE